MLSVRNRANLNRALSIKCKSGFPSTGASTKSIKVGYGHLPAELRNRIAHNALVPGRIYLPQVVEALGSLGYCCTVNHHYEGRKPWRSRVRGQARALLLQLTRVLIRVLVVRKLQLEAPPRLPATHAAGLLATSRGIYHETHVMYYSLNTFCLPPGPLSHSEYIFGNMAPQHKSLIKSVAVQFSFADLTFDIVDHIEAEFRNVQVQSDSEREATRWGILASSCLAEMWQRKRAWVQKWDSLDELRLESFKDAPMILKGNDIRVGRIAEQYVRLTSWRAEFALDQMIATIGLEAARQELSEPASTTLRGL